MKNESAENGHPVQTPPTPDDLKAIEKRRLERLEFERILSDHNFRSALAVGQARKQQKG